MKKERITLKTRRWGLPLYGQVLTWFFINISLVFLILWLVLKFQFGVSLAGVFEEEIQSRVEPRAELVAADLRESPRSAWEEILLTRGRELGAQIAVLTEDGKWAGRPGLPATLTAEMEARCEKMEPAALRGRPEGKSGWEDKGAKREGPEEGELALLEGGKPPPLFPSVRESCRMVFAGKGSEGGRWAVTKVDLGGEEFRHPPQALLVMYAREGAKSEIFANWLPFLVLAVGLLLFSGLLWFPFVHRVTRRLRLMTEGAERISEGNFEVNVASNRGDEIGRLSRVIQRMSVRLSQLVEGQKRFLGDTAHELCSPLVRIRMGLGVLEQQLDGPNRDRLEAVEGEVGELARLVDELLEFSKSSFKKNELALQPVILRELCIEVSEKEALGNDCEVLGGYGVEIQTSPDLLRRALGNLVRNSARYGEGKPLQVKIEKHGDEVWIGVLDRGPGLPDGWTERVFEPFARPEEARTREGGGAGLGLAIVQTCAESLSGRVFCRNRETGGLEVVLVIPVDGK